jgi:AcrR family transcriptional regulator
LEEGFDRATMSAIAARLGGSKATLYSYFRSKEELLLAAVRRRIERHSDELMGELDALDNLREGLERFAAHYLSYVLSAEVVGMTRIVMAQPESSGIGRRALIEGLVPAWRRMEDYMARAMAAGDLQPANPWRAALHLKGLLDADLLDQRLHGMTLAEVAGEVEAVARDGVDAFFRAYSAEAA